MKDSSNTIPKPRILVQGILCGYCHISLWILLRGEKFFGICTLKNKRISECGKSFTGMRCILLSVSY